MSTSRNQDRLTIYMSRNILLLGICLPLAIILLLGYYARSSTAPNRDAIMFGGQQVMAPLLTALEQYQSQTGVYPPSLDRLVQRGLLSNIPHLPCVDKSIPSSGPLYEVSPEGEFFTLTIAYDLPDSRGWEFWITSIYSSESKGWVTGKYPPGFDGLYTDWIGKQYRTTQTAASLRNAVHSMIKAAKVGGYSLAQTRVMEVLGNGANVEIPQELAQRSDTAGLLYTPMMDSEEAFLFLFHIEHLQVVREQKPFSMLRAAYRRVLVDGRATWEVIWKSE